VGERREEMKIVIPGRPATKKNNPSMVKGRNLILPNKQYREAHRFLIGTKTRPGYLLLHYGNIQFTEPVEMVVDYFLADRRMPDVGNLISATCDLLQDAGIVYNDSQIWTITAAITGIDRKNPRTELILDIKKPEWWREDK
jgi:hypothetical protein